MGHGASTAAPTAVASPKSKLLLANGRTASMRFLPPEELIEVHNTHVSVTDDQGNVWQGGAADDSPAKIKREMHSLAAKGRNNLELFDMLVQREHVEEDIRGSTNHDSRRSMTLEDIRRPASTRPSKKDPPGSLIEFKHARIHRSNSSLIPCAHQTKTIKSRTTIQYRCVDRARVTNTRHVGSANQRATSVHEVDAEVLSLISDAMLHFFYACGGLFEILHPLVEEASQINLDTNQTLMTEGEHGDCMFVLQTGEMNALKDGTVVTPGKSVGELALIFNDVRECTVIATEPCVVWAISRESFQTLQASNAFQTANKTAQALQDAGCLKSLSLYSQRCVAKSMDKAHFDDGQKLLEENGETDTCMLVEEGSVAIRSSTLDADAIVAKFAESESMGKIWKDGDAVKGGPGLFLGSLVLLGAAGMEGGDPFNAERKQVTYSLEVVAIGSVGVSKFSLDVFEMMVGPPAEVLVHGTSHHYGSLSGARHVPPVTDLTLADFRIDNFLGEGGFGRVLHAECTKEGCRLQGKPYAIKIMDKKMVVEKGETSHVKNERRMLEVLHHPLVLGLEASFQDQDRLFLVTDYVCSVSMFDVIYEPEVKAPDGDGKPALTRHWVANIVEAMAHIHAQGIAYRDLKPENLLMDSSGKIVIIDMGFAKSIPYDDANEEGELVHHDESFTLCGTFEYLAPEFFFEGHKHTHAVDLWAMGCLFYEFVAEKTPFVDQPGEDDMKKIFTRICKTKFRPVEVPEYFDDVTLTEGGTEGAYRGLLQGLLTSDYHKRLGFSSGGTFAIKSLPYFDGFDWERLDSPPWAPPPECFAESLRPLDECPDALEVTVPFDREEDPFDGW